jgi:asparagine synthase (glutamine-hydrolysing)
MCGIWGLIGNTLNVETVKNIILLLKARGPEGSSILNGDKFQLGFTRLALNGLSESGMQPMFHSNKDWICNGEIYNWKELAKEIGYVNKSGSDCEILGPLLNSTLTLHEFFNKLHGVFAMIISDGDRIIVGRDPYGIRPLFMSLADSRIILSSELKAIFYGSPKPFPPGHYAVINKNTLQVELFQYHFMKINPIPRDDVFAQLRSGITSAVRRRMLTERPIAALLSGGLDSSLIAALVQEELRIADRPPLETFSIGFQDSEDLRNARLVANHIGSIHTEIIMTPDQFFEAIPEVIHDIESYDITTVRASVGNWLVAREISLRSECKVVFNGDGADELFGGYLYFYRAPSNDEFEDESNRLLKDIHLFDVLRSDRCISSHGLEPRTPFLDKEFVDLVKSIPVDLRRPSVNQMEKWVLRRAFRDTNILPMEVLYRKKEAFSDGVSTHGGLSWYQECQARAFQQVPDWKDNIPDSMYLKPYTAESYYYRKLFDALYFEFGHVIPYFWMPKWSPETSDPSARTLSPATMDTSKKNISSIEELLHFAERF